MATYDVTQSVPAANDLRAGDILNCPYSGAKVTIQLPPGEYEMTCWGAQGGSYNENNAAGGKGARTSVIGTLTDYVTCYLYTGGKGSYRSTSSAGVDGGGFNGGGNAAYRGGGGGGASDIRFGTDSLYSRGVVAGGGGGAYAYSSTYKAAGGYAGAKAIAAGDGATYSSSYTAFAGKGANNQTPGAGGTSTSGTAYNGVAGTFGVGGNTASGYYASTYPSNGAGGGGWYGGGGAANYNAQSRNRAAGGGGGNSYAYAGSWTSDAPSGFSIPSTVTLAGNAPTSAGGNESMTDPDGSTVTGHAGDGYIRITVNAVTRKPTTPTDLAVTTTYDSATLTWTGDSLATSYTVYRNGTQVASGVTATSYTITGLDDGTTYTFGVKAVNSYGSSSTATKSATTPVRPPDAPAYLSVYAVTAREVLLTWPLAPTGSGYTVRLYRGSTKILDTDATTTNYYTDVGRTPGTAYNYKVAYYNGALSDYATASATTLGSVLDLITDRTQADVDTVKALSASGYGAWSAAEIAAWDTEALKGAYNVSDILRVIDAMDYIADLLNAAGFAITLQSSVTGWAENAERPTASQMAAYLADLTAIQAALQLPSHSPDLPESMALLDYIGANAIEQMLLDVNETLRLYQLTMFPPCGLAGCGGDYL